ncbi:secretin N-terminal domain-containing protein [Nitrosomonas mobilis]|uniref:Type II and III secretion system protein n=1 Tax=Nitrosomonas mobilis TaxID=51642 RepID=A0A1G5SFV0_9PROT|nr:secretin N-terminal domain-containing protein [Nitrosomonas mobilis]SCZ85740.1 Type II and III secretion system protein [Nitrosomonas mobilis]
MNASKPLLVLLLLIWMAGCASYTTKNPAFLQGKQLITEGQFEAGLGKLQQAADEEPENIEIRVALVRELDSVAGQLLLQADNELLTGNIDAAEQAYLRVLGIAPNNERAIAGLEAAAIDRKHNGLVKQAKEYMANDQIEAAEKIIRGVLAENPAQADARQLVNELSERISRAEMSQLSLVSAFRQPITMEFRDAPLKTIFELISRTAGINFIFDRTVQQEAKTSIFVRDNPIEDVLKLILLTNQLAYKVLNENSLLIYPDTPAKQKDYQELVVRSFHINNTDVKQMVAMVRGLVKARDIYVNERLNLFIMRDTLEMIRLVERLVTINDFPDPEVMLEVEVLEINRNNALKLGPDMPTQTSFSFLPGVGTAAPVLGADGLLKLTQTSIDGLRNFSIANQVLVEFRKTLTANDILANPRIRVKSREKAKIMIGDKIPIFSSNATSTGVVSQNVTFLDVGLKLEVEPVISPNSEVSIKILLEVSTLGARETSGTTTAFRIGTRSAETLLFSRDGETQVLAGLIQDQDRRGLSGIAGLVDIPVLGRLFASQNLTRDKTEIVLLITPRIVRNVIQPSNFESEFHSGTASAAGNIPVNIRKTAPQSLSLLPSGGAGGLGGSNVFGQALRSGSRDNEETVNPFEAAAAQARSPVPTLNLQAPASVAMGREFTATVRLITQNTQLTGEVDLGYDQSALELMDGAENSGSRTLKFGREQPTGMTSILRFKVIGANTGTTTISVDGVRVQDEKGEAVEIQAPPVASITLQ